MGSPTPTPTFFVFPLWRRIFQVVIAVVLENFVLQWTARRERRAAKMHFLGKTDMLAILPPHW